MKSTSLRVAFLVVSLVFAPVVWAQTPAASAAAAEVPRLIKFSGTLLDAQDRPLAGPVGVTFALHAQQTGGAALWMETQNVTPDAHGFYTVLLGANSANGVPAELFASGEARWLEVQVERQAEQPRILLVSVPYALKAGDADSLGGIPASAFLTMQALQASGNPGSPSTSPAGPTLFSAASSITAAAISGGGTTNFVPLWISSSALGNSLLFQIGGNVGISTKTPAGKLDVNGSAFVRGTLQLPALGTATSTTGFNSNGFDFLSSSFNSSTQRATSQHFRWQAEPVGNNTTSPSGKLSLLFAAGAATPAETGLSIGNTGLITFASGQTFFGAYTAGGDLSGTATSQTVIGVRGVPVSSASPSGGQVLTFNGSSWTPATPASGGTITGVTAGTDLTGGGNSGVVTLNVDTSKVVTAVTAGTDLTGGGTGGTVTLNVDTTKVVTAVLAGADLLGGGTGGTVTLSLDTNRVPQLFTPNTFSADQTINGNLNLSGSINGGLVVQPNSTSPNLIAGFSGNTVSSSVPGATIGGGGISGNINSVTASFGTVGGGLGNTAFAHATVGGGGSNTASGISATVGGGGGNTAGGNYATVPGGYSNQANGTGSFAAGQLANAAHDGAFVWGDNSTALNAGNRISSTAANQFVARAVGGFSFIAGIDGSGNPIAANTVSIAPGGIMTFASGQTFPGTGGGTITGVTAGTDLAGGGTTGNVTLSLNTNATDARYAQLGAMNNFTNSQSVAGNLAVGGTVSVTGNITGNGSVTASSFTGSGAGLTGVSASALTAGTYGNALSFTNGGNSFAGNGSGLSNLNASALTNGSVPGGALSGTYSNPMSFPNGGNSFAGNGSGLSNVNAAALNGFTSNFFAQLAAANTFSADQTINGNLNLSGSINGGLIVQPNSTSPNVIGGFSGNSVSSGVTGATIGGGGASGIANSVTASFGTVGGGNNNTAGLLATVGGGYSNSASGTEATLGGGFTNTASGTYGTVAGGFGNTASGLYTTVGGGVSNTAGGKYATVPGGFANQANGIASFAAGTKVIAANDGAFVWGDDSTLNTIATLSSTAANQFIARAIGGFSFVAGIDGSGNPIAANTVSIAPNTGIMTFASGQTFPGAGSGTITGVTAGTALTGGGNSGNVTLNIDLTKIPQLNAANTFNGNQSVTGNLNASSFTGDGSGLTHVNASSLGGLAPGAFAQLGANANNFSGNISAQAFSGNGAGLSNLNASALNGSVPGNALSGTYSNPMSFPNPSNSFTGNGSGLSNVNAVTLNGLQSGAFVNTVMPGPGLVGGGTGGTVSLSVDTSKVPQLGAANTFTADQTINGTLSATTGNFNGAVSTALGLTKGNPLNLGGDLGLYSNTTSTFMRFVTRGGNFSWYADGDYGANPVMSLTAGGILTTNSYTGNGAGLTGVSASALTAGTYGNALSFTNGGNLFAGNGSGLSNLNASALNGSVPGNALSGTYSNPMSFPNGGNSFAGNGSGLSNVNAATLNGFPSSAFAPAFGSSQYIQNQSVAAQPANFNINGNGTINGSFTVTGGLVVQPNVTGCLGTCTSANVIGGFSGNSVPSGVTGATIGGGGESGLINSVTFPFGTVGGGEGNTASGQNATVGGGFRNTASGAPATVGGGQLNTASGVDATVAGGSTNTVSGVQATVGGGFSNIASGQWATVPGGVDNQATGLVSFAAGHSTRAAHDGAFVWGDDAGGNPISSTAPNQFIVRATGGVWFGSTNKTVSFPTGSFIATDTGAYLSTGGVWTNASDRNLKANFAGVDGQAVLARLAAIPILTWNYKTQDPAIRHMGPMAQDFGKAFALGEDDKHIATIDSEGVALAAIQELYRLAQQKDARIQEQSEQIKKLTSEVEELRAMKEQLTSLEARINAAETGERAGTTKTASSIPTAATTR